MNSRVVDLNVDVIAARRLRVAAMVPTFVALICGVAAVLVFALAEQKWFALAFLVGVAVFASVARHVERGNRWAMWLVTVLLAAASAVGVLALVESPMELVGAAGTVLILGTCWLLLWLGLSVMKHREAAAAIRVLFRSPWGRLPRSRPSPEAMRSFTIAGIIYAAGLVPAALATLAGGHLVIGAIVYLPIAKIASRFWLRGRQQSMLAIQTVRRLDPRSPVILLRSFADDSLPLGKRHHLLSMTSEETLTLEQFVVDKIWRFGPVLAIGNPSDRLSPLGAAREYIPEDRWRASVQEYLKEAHRVVCILGDTPGLQWEYEQIEMLGKDQGAIVVFPPREADELQRRWSLFQRMSARARPVNLQWDPFIGVPLLALLASESVLVFYCKYRHETAYAAAFSRLFGIIEAP
jgi:hypothetical protein